MKLDWQFRKGKRVSRRAAFKSVGGMLSSTIFVAKSFGQADQAERIRQLRARGEASRPVPVNVDAITERLPRTAKAIEAAASRGRSGQLYISRDGEVVSDFA